MSNLQTTIQWAKSGLSAPGCWAYPDMLEIGCHGLPLVEGRSHFCAWCIVSSPLIISMDLTDDVIMDEVWPIITNAEALAVSAAWHGMSGTVFQTAELSVILGHSLAAVPVWQYWCVCASCWKRAHAPARSSPHHLVFLHLSLPRYKPIDTERTAVLLMNHDSQAANFVLTFANVPGLSGTATYQLRDINTNTDLGSFSGTWSISSVASHDSVFLMISSA